ncbi:MAG: glutamate formiminotransferase, partial [Tissierellia bacterium]|nr:glutamate formiminotransferase [Tissierellia bacterium]
MKKVLMAEVNVSEGTDLDLVNQITDEMVSVEGVEVVAVEPDADHNRTVFTFKGEPAVVLESTKRLVKKAIELIDMTK